MQINTDFSLTATLKDDQYQWVPSPQAGVERVMLDRIGDEKARATSIVRYATNSEFPTHFHPGGEEILVLSGTFSDQSGDFPKGWYLRNPPGTSHAPSSIDGATIFVKLWQMQDSNSTTVGIDTQDQSNWTHDKGRAICPLYQDNQETTSLQRLTDGETLFNCQATQPMCEIFVLSGSVIFNHIEYPKGSWLRLASSEQQIVKAGKLGATVYIKVGNPHLTDDYQKPFQN
ncbi:MULTISPECIES: cupin domain-containing protein [unclassified Vibrio]|uniref:Cupin domain-containing protein n=1 Tax=Vibrio sp. HB236076 TaxID=3232307 RepID=A0AB39HCB4_9VIBR|nr:cupin domain-containing protein [Vibrio sp. HB161653]MDP5253762.1 cupin domain-containing protein [Vibrio sp. HB161653]